MKSMATTLRGSSVGREKRGTTGSSSSSVVKKSPKPASQTPAEKTSTITGVKPVPNYLRPTRKASLDLTKRSSPDLVQKPVVNRRRSFDRPPPVSQLQKVIRNVSEVKPLRSTSFSHKQGSSSLATTSTRPASSDRTYARTTSALKEGRIDTSRSIIKRGSLSSSITPTTKNDTKKKVPKSVTSESSIDHDNHLLIDQLIIEDDLVNMDNIEVQSLPDMSEMPDINQELGDPTIPFADVDVRVTDEIVDQVVEKTIEIVHQTVETQLEVRNLGDETDSKAQNFEQTVTEKKEAEAFEQDIEKNEEGTDDKVENPSVITPAASPEAVKETQNVAGKKEKQDYNDVIEETATKLMGGRKNKVLALAGAFETVISLQDTGKN